MTLNEAIDRIAQQVGNAMLGLSFLESEAIYAADMISALDVAAMKTTELVSVVERDGTAYRMLLRRDDVEMRRNLVRSESDGAQISRASVYTITSDVWHKTWGELGDLHPKRIEEVC